MSKAVVKQTDPQNVSVIVDGEIRLSYNLLADDYAWTNAREAARKINNEAMNEK